MDDSNKQTKVLYLNQCPKRHTSNTADPLTAAIYDSFDAMTPDDETIDRMLTTLHQEVDLTGAGHGAPRSVPVSPSKASRRRRRFRLELWGSMAACLVLIIGVCAVLFASPQFNILSFIPGQNQESVVRGPYSSVVHDYPASGSSSSRDSASSSKADDKETRPDTNSSNDGDTGSSAVEASGAYSSNSTTMVPPPTPVVSLNNGETITVVQSDNQSEQAGLVDNHDYIEADTSLIQSKVDQGTVYDETRGAEVEYVVFNYEGSEADYAIQFDGSSAIYLAVSDGEGEAMDSGESLEVLLPPNANDSSSSDFTEPEEAAPAGADTSGVLFGTDETATLGRNFGT